MINPPRIVRLLCIGVALMFLLTTQRVRRISVRRLNSMLAELDNA